jgi:aminoglycoside phosphotransferase (APT) family kinase protein
MMGRACGELAVSGLTPTQSFRGMDQVERSGRYVRSLSLLAPHLAEQAGDLVDDLATVHQRLGERVLKPIHGAPHMHQWLVDGERLGLVDFDRHCLGDPELDAATFVAEMDCENSATVPREILSAAFLRGYADVAGPLEPHLLAAYRAHKRLAKAEKAARKPLVDAVERAARHLQAARRMLVDTS